MKRTAVGLATISLAASTYSLSAATPASAGVPIRPDIILIVTDDQRWDTVTPAFMPRVTRLLTASGVTYTNAFVPNALCCPSRVSTLTGTYSHTSGVYGNDSPHGGFNAFNDRRTVATALDGDYRTLFVGKYMNRYPGGSGRKGPHWTYVPPGWNRWFAIPSGEYFNYHVARNGKKTALYGDRPADYSTRVLTDEAVRYIRATDPAIPYFLHYAPAAPHGSRATVPSAPGFPIPDPRDKGRFNGIEDWRPASFGNLDSVKDMPSFIRSLRWRAEERHRIDLFRQRQLESIYSNDRQIARLLAAAEARDPGLGNTIVIFTSDNGFLWGEHRWSGKVVPYEESIRVPLIIRFPDGVVGTDTRIALNVDLVPTLLEIAGYDPATTITGTDNWRSDGHLIPPEGESLLSGGFRGATVLEQWNDGPAVPGYCGVRTSDDFMYVRYWDRVRKGYHGRDNGFEELYDVNADPMQQVNLAGDPRHADKLDELKTMARDLCIPMPPHYSWSTGQTR